jgi:hypothetical protein
MYIQVTTCTGGSHVAGSYVDVPHSYYQAVHIYFCLSACLLLWRLRFDSRPEHVSLGTSGSAISCLKKLRIVHCTAKIVNLVFLQARDSCAVQAYRAGPSLRRAGGARQAMLTSGKKFSLHCVHFR